MTLDVGAAGRGLGEVLGESAAGAVGSLHGLVEEHLRDGGAVDVRRAGPFLLVDGRRVDAGASGRDLVAGFEAWHLRGLRLEAGLRPAELAALLALLASEPRGAQIWPGAAARLRDAGVEHVRVETAAPGTGPVAAVLGVQRQLARDIYGRAVQAYAEFAAGVVAGGAPALAPLRRAVHRCVDLLDEEDATLVGLTCVKTLRFADCQAEALPAHAVNVAILSLLLGRAAGIGRGDLAALGIAALLHDIRHARPAPEATPAAGVTAEGARDVARILDVAPVDVVGLAALVALEKRMCAAAPEHLAQACAATRIVQVADAYDQLTAGNPGSSPDVALGRLQAADARVDVRVVDLLVRQLGIYPPGTVVELDAGERGVVLRANRDARALDRPIVGILLDRDGRPVDGAVVDCAARGHDGTGRRIVRGVDRREAGVDPATIFLGACD